MAARTKPSSDIAYLCRALKAPSLAASVERLSERARVESWTHEEFLAACLKREVASRQDHGGENRIRAARFPARKSLEDFDFDHQRSLKRDVIAHLGTLDFVEAKENVVFLGPPGTGKTHLATGLGIRACQAGHRVAFATRARPPGGPPRRAESSLTVLIEGAVGSITSDLNEVPSGTAPPLNAKLASQAFPPAGAGAPEAGRHAPS